MSTRLVSLLGAGLLAACSGSAGPAPSISRVTPSPGGSPTPTVTPASSTATPTTSSVAIEQQCRATPVFEGRVVALASTTASQSLNAPPAALLDLTDPRAPQQLCTLKGLPPAVRFVGPSVLGYAAYQGNGNPSDGEIGRFDLLKRSTQTVAHWQSGGFGAGVFGWSSDGSLAYIVATAGTEALTGAGLWELHLLRQARDRILFTLPGVAGRGISSDNDDTFLAFSPDGKYLALETTFTGPSQVRLAVDGSLVQELPQGATMAVWAGSSLFYRDQAGVHRWDISGAAGLVLPGVDWIRPRASPDGKWIAYAVRDFSGLPHVNVFNVSTGTTFMVSAGGRTDAVFLTPTVLWDREERICTESDQCGMVQTLPTGLTFVYDLAARHESRSDITAVADVWPRMD